MGKKSNDALTAVVLIKSLKNATKSEKRDQLGITDLRRIIQYGEQAIGYLVSAECGSQTLTTALSTVVDCAKGLLENNITETDVEMKQVIVKEVEIAERSMYREVGEYYEKENEFDYSEGLAPLLRQIVDACVSEGIYFGQDKEEEQDECTDVLQ